MEFKSFFTRHKLLFRIFLFYLNILAQVGRVIRIIPYSESSNIVLISLHKIGDSVFAFPAVRYLHEKYAENLYVICWESVSDVYSILDFKSNIITINNNEYLFSNRIAGRKARKKIKSIKPAIIFDVTGSVTSASLIWGIRTKETIGRNEKYYQKFYDKFVTNIDKPHLSDRYFDPIKLVHHGADINNYRTVLSETIDRELRILIHPFAGWAAKEWNLSKFIELGEKLSRDYYVKMIFEKGKIDVDILKEVDGHKIHFKETSTLIELINNIKDCSLFIGNDSGPVNIANYLGKSTITIFGPTNPVFHAGSSENNIVIQNIISCSPSNFEKYCKLCGGLECPSFECMNILTISDVYFKIKSFIDQRFQTY